MRCWFFPLFLCLMVRPLAAQTDALEKFEVILVGPQNTDRHHAAQVDYYVDYYYFLDDEIDRWLEEVDGTLRVIRKRNRRRIEAKRPIRSRDYPQWRRSMDLMEVLLADKQLVRSYIDAWQAFDYTKPDSVTKVFMSVFAKDDCYDLISEELVLAPKEYKISLFEPAPERFSWNEFIPKTSFQCPDGYRPAGKNCQKKMEVEVITPLDPEPVFQVRNLLNDLPFHLEGFKQITCSNQGE